MQQLKIHDLRADKVLHDVNDLRDELESISLP